VTGISVIFTVCKRNCIFQSKTKISKQSTTSTTTITTIITTTSTTTTTTITTTATITNNVSNHCCYRMTVVIY